MVEYRSHDGDYVIVDCASFTAGQVLWNQFIYVDAAKQEVAKDIHIQDTFVRYNAITKRKI